MANPTTNFGWVMPTSTSLVTNLPADFNTFGQGVDTSLQYLLGGTTGQVLSKTSNTNMAFTWVTPTDQTPLTTKGDLFAFSTVDARLPAGANETRLVADSTQTLGLKYVADTTNYAVDAKGDLLAGTAADTVARLAVGNNGETLVADSSTSSGLRYQAPVNANPVINSAMQVWQRGTSFAVSGSAAYTADRWQAISAAYTAGLTVSRQATNDTTNLPNIQYCARVQRDSGNTSTASRNLQQNFESINSIPYAGKTVTLSFYARAGANYSATSSLLGTQWVWGTGTDQNNYLTGLTGSTNVSATTSVTLTTTWQRFTITGTVGSTATQIAINFNFNGVGTAGTNDYFEVTGVQMEVGSVATPFKTYAGTIQGELAACQRYYQQYAGGLGVPYNGVANSATTLMTYLAIQPTMRTAATCTVGGTLYADDGYAGTVSAASPTVDFVDQYQGGGRFRIGGFSGMTTGRHYSFYYNTGYIGLSAEL